MSQLIYQKPTSIKQAETLFQGAEESRFLAGGMTLLPTMRQRLVAPDRLIDLAALDLCHIEDQGSVIKIGAMTTHNEIATSPIIQNKIKGLAGLAGGIGDRQVRHRGTIGGSVANNDPAACYPAGLLALGAVIQTSHRQITASDYFVDLFETALEEGELITSIIVPVPQKSAYFKAPNPASRYALAGVFAALIEDAPHIAVTGAGEQGVFRWHEAEAALANSWTTEALADLSLSDEGLFSDIHATPSFRSHLVKQMAQKAVEQSA